MNEQVKYKIILELNQQTNTLDIAQKYDVSMSDVIRLRKEFMLAAETNDFSSIISDEHALAKLSSEIAMSGPITEEVVGVVLDVSAEDKLKESLFGTGVALSNKIRTQLINISNVEDLHTLSAALAVIQDAFFNKKQINIQNNTQHGNNSYSEWLDDKPGS